MGRKFRSQNEVRRYLDEIGSELCPDLFCFSPYGQAGTPNRRRRGGAPTSTSKSVKKLASKAVQTVRVKSLGGAGDASSSSSKLKLKLDCAKRAGRPVSTGKPGRLAAKPGQPVAKPGKVGQPVSAGKTGRPPGRPGRPAGSGSSLASPPLRPTAPRTAVPSAAATQAKSE